MVSFIMAKFEMTKNIKLQIQNFLLLDMEKHLTFELPSAMFIS